jgi:hypothetical protein
MHREPDVASSFDRTDERAGPPQDTGRDDRDDMGRVVSFRPRGAASAREHTVAAKWLAGKPRSPVADIGQYEGGDAEDDYRHRMTMNVLAFMVILVLAGAGMWLATAIAEMRKNQDCVLSGRPGCTHIDVPPRER